MSKDRKPPDLNVLLERAAHLQLGPSNAASQRQSFAIGSAALEANTLTRSSIVEIELAPASTDQSEMEVLNLLALYDFSLSITQEALRSGGKLTMSSNLIRKAHAVGLKGLAHHPGEFRKTDLIVSGSNLHAPKPGAIDQLVGAFCDYVNQNWDTASATHLSAYTLWRLLWIHPFSDGNGRVARALSYVVLCTKLGVIPPGTPTLPALIAQNKARYYLALENADQSYNAGKLDLHTIEMLIIDLLQLQLANVASLPDSTNARLTDSINARVYRSSPKLRQRLYENEYPKYQLWSQGAYLTLQISSQDDLDLTRERQARHLDPFPGLFTPDASEAAQVLGNNRSTYLFEYAKLSAPDNAPICLRPDSGIILQSPHVDSPHSTFSVRGSLYGLRFGPHTTIENCDELFDLLIAKHIRSQS